MTVATAPGPAHYGWPSVTSTAVAHGPAGGSLECGMRMTRGLTFLLLLLAAAALSAGWLQQRARASVAELITTLRPHLLLRYDQLIAWPPGGVRLIGVTLEPVGAWRTRLALPVGFRLEAEELMLLPLPSTDAGPVELQFQLRGLSATVPREHPHYALLADSGHDRFTGTLTAQLQWQPDRRQFVLDGDLQSLGVGRLDMAVALTAGPRFPAPVMDGTTLQHLALTWRDHGLLRDVKQTLALRQQAPLRRWELDLLRELDSTARQQAWAWQPEDAAALRGFIREPDALSVTLAPLTPVRLDNLPLYAPGDYWGLLGVQLTAPPPATLP